MGADLEALVTEEIEMRETQTNPKQPRDDEGKPPGSDTVRQAEDEPIEKDDPHRVEGRDRPPSGRNRGPSPWLGGG